jgi:predicted N-formylglutamate amidohydrolase
VSPKRQRRLVLSCEHGGNRVPAEYVHHFASQRAKRALNSHRGYDIGALRIARALAERFRVPLVSSEVTRLLCDLNRSVGHATHFSEFVASLTPSERHGVLAKYYFPHRLRVEAEVAKRLSPGVLHVAVHSFTPRLHGETRRADIGLLYDPISSAERLLCQRWKQALGELAPSLVVRRNYPYLGKGDGLASYLRRKFGTSAYIGVELETNQARLTGTSAVQRETLRALSHSIVELLGDALPD